MQALLQKIADSKLFQHTITLVIVGAGVLAGVETYEDLAERNAQLLHVFDVLIVTIFVVEAAIKIGAHGRHPGRYFKDSWNVFDFVIVVACFLPFSVKYILVLRLVRILRVLKLLRALPRLQLLVGALLKSIPAMAYVALLLFLLLYIYAVAGTFIFGKNDPIHFGELPRSMLSIFQAITMEGWQDLLHIQFYGCADERADYIEEYCSEPEDFPLVAPFFFVTLILIGTMIMLNLFIGVIMKGMEAAQEERERQQSEQDLLKRGERPPTLAEELRSLEAEMKALSGKMTVLMNRATEEESG